MHQDVFICSIGVLSELKNHGTSNRRQVEVNFPEDDDWDGFYDELEVVPPEPLKVSPSLIYFYYRFTKEFTVK